MNYWVLIIWFYSGSGYPASTPRTAMTQLNYIFDTKESCEQHYKDMAAEVSDLVCAWVFMFSVV